METTNVKAFGTDSTTAPLKEMNIERRVALPKDIEIEIPSHNSVDPTFHNIALVNSLNYCGNNYSSLFKELTSPPPETNI